ncbi:glutamate--cysteine ligase [Actinomadura barringtoniae]|uniref:Glutamate--cysteine ligase n=1 Tax=Actinomadura barringtoniae TaxID=1427535 RepID=A0A939T4S4_9ACTN|nr:glutamate-cysteine ligase family protein [Actinomadura barringtoniae]MBO2452901.1 glutamate--cysteine ligase [Actinomadura barringtoniae]
MGRDVAAVTISGEDRRRYRNKVLRCLDVLERMLGESQFDFERSHIGLEIELNLVDSLGDPLMRNADVLKAIADPAWATELGQFNLEINIPPRELGGEGTGELEREVRDHLNKAEHAARGVGASLVMIGILPTLRRSDIGEEALSPNARYRLLNDQIFAARGEELHIDIEGPEPLSMHADCILPEAACTSVQFHLQVSPERFGAHWNAAQAIAGPQVALGANSPFLFGHRLWHETRITLFEQATDTRPDELKAQGVRPRVWFGERWITSVFDLFEENTRYFPALLPLCDEEDPVTTIDAGGIPELGELSLHNGTVYRWNRPIYAVVNGRPHLRVENRVLPAGPTVADVVANGAFYYGVIRMLADEERPVWSRMSFSAARDNLHRAARDGMESRLYWPGLGDVPAAEVVLRELLPLAYEGLDRWGVDPSRRDRLLGIIERRCVTGRTGAAWQIDTVQAIEDSFGTERHEALRLMTRSYTDLMNTNEPVHTWPIGP